MNNIKLKIKVSSGFTSGMGMGNQFNQQPFVNQVNQKRGSCLT